MSKREEIGLRIRTMRKSRGMTQSDLALAINQSASSITMYETGRREPDFETLEAMADTFNVPLRAIIGQDNMTDEAQTIAEAVNRLPKEKREQALNVFKVMFPDIFVR